MSGVEAAGWWTSGRTDGAEGTRALAAALARTCRPGDVVLLVGGLGAGKTTFAQGFARGLGIEGPVTSPTFTLVRQYRCTGGAVRQLLHADLYRLETMVEVVDLGLAELVEDGGVALVEWGDAAGPALGDSALSVTLIPGAPGDPGPAGDGGSGAGAPGDEPRLIVLEGRGPAWSGRGGDVARAIGGTLAAPAPGAAPPASGTPAPGARGR